MLSRDTYIKIFKISYNSETEEGVHFRSNARYNTSLQSNPFVYRFFTCPKPLETNTKKRTSTRPDEENKRYTYRGGNSRRERN
jgi:hypothetical protein